MKRIARPYTAWLPAHGGPIKLRPFFYATDTKIDKDHNEACAGIYKQSYRKLSRIAGYLPNEEALCGH